MKRIFSIMLCMILLCTFTGCGTDERVENAIEALSEHWTRLYDELNIEDEYLEIVNTMIINIRDDIDKTKFAEQKEIFEDIDYIVEFELVTNMWESSPYYTNVYKHNCVIVYKNGDVSVNDNLFNVYRATTYSSDFSGIIESVENFHDEYDGIIK